MSSSPRGKELTGLPQTASEGPLHGGEKTEEKKWREKERKETNGTDGRKNTPPKVPNKYLVT